MELYPHPGPGKVEFPQSATNLTLGIAGVSIGLDVRIPISSRMSDANVLPRYEGNMGTCPCPWVESIDGNLLFVEQ